MQLINEIARTNKYYPLCKKYAKREWKTDELHQEFLLRLCEIGEGKVLEAKEGGYLDWFCFDVIWKIWMNRNRVKCYERGSTNPLYELTGVVELTAEDDLVYDNDLLDFDKYVKESIVHIQRDINSDDMILNFRSRVFAYSVGLKIEDGVVKLGGSFKSIRQFSNTTKIPMSAAHSAFVKYKKELRNKLRL